MEAGSPLIEAGSLDPAIHWETKLDRARTAALAANKPLLIEFWAVWCENCREMDDSVYSNERIATGMAKVVPVRIDIDGQTDVARKYAVSGTPTLVLADSYGNELFRYVGALPLDRMLELLKALPGDVTPFNRLAETLARDKNNFAALAALGREQRGASFYRASNETFARALRTREGRAKTPDRAAILLTMGQNALELRQVDDAIRSFEQVRREFPGTPSADEAARLLPRR